MRGRHWSVQDKTRKICLLQDDIWQCTVRQKLENAQYVPDIIDMRLKNAITGRRDWNRNPKAAFCVVRRTVRDNRVLGLINTLWTSRVYEMKWKVKQIVAKLTTTTRLDFPYRVLNRRCHISSIWRVTKIFLNNAFTDLWFSKKGLLSIKETDLVLCS